MSHLVEQAMSENTDDVIHWKCSNVVPRHLRPRNKIEMMTMTMMMMMMVMMMMVMMMTLHYENKLC